jgi:hypothetical protein
MVGYSLSNVIRLVTGIPVGVWTNVASINLPSAYGMWFVEFECIFSTVSDELYSIGLTTTSGGVPFGLSERDQYARSASSAMTIGTSRLIKNSALNETIYGVARSTVACGISQVGIRFTRLG